MNLAERIIVALDVPSTRDALQVLETLPQLKYVKVGMELYYSCGPDIVYRLKERGLKVFLDLKIHDIPHTAAATVRSISRFGCDMINLHCAGGLDMMRLAREAAQTDTKLIGVTQLTSIDRNTLNKQLLISGSVEDCVIHYAKLAKQAGLCGIVCSANEVRKIKSILGTDFLTVTPGIRLEDSTDDDQRRTMTPSKAIVAGSDYLVIGRPLLNSSNPEQTFADILREIEGIV